MASHPITPLLFVNILHLQPVHYSTVHTDPPTQYGLNSQNPSLSIQQRLAPIHLQMNDGEAAKKQGSPAAVVSGATNGVGGGGGAGGGLFSKSRYKFWAIAAILLLALWSMFTGSVTLKWSGAGNVNNPLSDAFDSPVRDLDILEVEEREKLVRRFWNVYTHSKTTRLPRFWQEAFEAAYEHLTGDVAGSRDAAVSEIAKMSLVSVDVEPLPLKTGVRQVVGRKNGA